MYLSQYLKSVLKLFVCYSVVWIGRKGLVMRVLYAALLCVLCLSADAREPRLEQALLERIEQARNFVIPDGIEFRYDLLQGSAPMAQEELERLRRLAPSDPNANLRLKKYESELELGGKRSEYALYYADQDSWRTSTRSLNYSLSPYIEHAKGEDGYWGMGSRQLTVAKRLDERTEEARWNPEFYLTLFQKNLSSWTTGILWPSDAEIDIVDSSTEGALGRLTVHMGSLRFVIQVERDQSDESWASFRVIEIKIYDRESGEHTATSMFRGWKVVPDFGFQLPEMNQTVFSDGTIESEYSGISLRPLSRDIGELTALPDADGVDPIRGQVTFSSVRQLGSDETEILDTDTREVLDVVKSDQEEPTTAWGSAIWLVLIGVVVIVFVVVRKRSVNE